MYLNPIFLAPVFKETVWGGTQLREFAYDIPSEKTGECWAVCAHPHGDNIILNPEYNGVSLSTLWNTRRELFGNCTYKDFPILTKIIDAKEDLSIQVHPDDEYAYKYENSSGKTECWYILDCKENANIVIGHNAKTKEELDFMIKNHLWNDLIREVPVHKGDFFFIEPGTVHAIKKNTLILETQQSSDITYRLYDYDRLSDGKLRDLHIKQSLDVIKSPFIQKEPPLNLLKTKNSFLKQLVSCKYFTVWHYEVDGSIKLLQDQDFMIVSVLKGEGLVDGIKVSKGTHFILPYKYGLSKIEGKLELVISAV